MSLPGKWGFVGFMRIDNLVLEPRGKEVASDPLAALCP